MTRFARWALILGALPVWLQGQVGIGTLTPDASAILHLESPNRGLLVPRVDFGTTTIAAPSPGLVVYNSATNVLRYRSTADWVDLRQTVAVPGGGIDLTNVPSGLQSIQLISGTADNQTLIWNNATSTWTAGSIPGAGLWQAEVSPGTGVYYPAGNVGIGATAPEQALHIQRSLPTQAQGILVRNTGVGLGTFASVTLESGGVNLSNFSGVASGGEALGGIGTFSNHPLLFLVNNFEALRINTDRSVAVTRVGGLSSLFVSNFGGTGNLLGLATSGGTFAAPTPTPTATPLGQITFSGQSGTTSPPSYTVGASIVSTSQAAFGPGSGASSLAFSTNGGAALATRMTIRPNGNVGIGTTNPVSRLELHDLDRPATGDQGITIHTATATEDVFLDLRTDAANNDAAIWLDQTDAQKLKFSLGTVGSRANRLGNTRMTMDQTGNVGIGTTTPAAPLDVVGNVRLSGELTFAAGGNIRPQQSTTTTGQALTIQAGASSGGPGTDQGGELVLQGGTGTASGGSDAGGNVRLVGGGGQEQQGNVLLGWTGSTPLGQVGVGVGLPLERLHVGGRVHLDDQATLQAGNKLYASGGNLYWGSTQVGGGTFSQWTTNGTSIEYSTGFVGIGTAGLPLLSLDVAGVSGTNNGIGFRQAGAPWDHVYLSHDNTNAYLRAGGATALRLQVANGTTGAYDGQTYNDGLTITAAGNVGVGTTNPTLRFQLSDAGTNGSMAISNSATTLSGSVVSVNAIAPNGVSVGGFASGDGGIGVVGGSFSPSGFGVGVRGAASSATGHGVVGINGGSVNLGSIGSGVYGYTTVAGTIGGIFTHTVAGGTALAVPQGRVGIGTSSPSASAAVEIASTTGGFLLPRMTAAQRTAIASPANGLVVYQTDDVQGIYQYTAGAWALTTNPRIAFQAALGGSTGDPVPLNTDVLLPLDFTSYNIGGGFNTSTFLFTAPVAGVYHFDGFFHAFTMATTSGTDFEIAFVNSSNIAYAIRSVSLTGNDPPQSATISMDIQLAAGETVGLRVNTGLTGFYSSGAFRSRMTGHLVFAN